MLISVYRCLALNLTMAWKKYLHWNIAIVIKMQHSVAMNTIANIITLSSLGFPFDKILRVRKSIESLVQVLAIANRI